MDGVDDVCPDKGEPSEAATVDHSDGQRGTVQLLFRQFNVKELDCRSKVGVPLGIENH